MSKEYIVTYMRYRQRYDKEFDSAKEAAQWTLDQEDQGDISYETITDPSGIVIADNNNRGYEDLYALGAKWTDPS